MPDNNEIELEAITTPSNNDLADIEAQNNQGIYHNLREIYNSAPKFLGIFEQNISIPHPQRLYDIKNLVAKTEANRQRVKKKAKKTDQSGKVVFSGSLLTIATSVIALLSDNSDSNKKNDAAGSNWPVIIIMGISFLVALSCYLLHNRRAHFTKTQDKLTDSINTLNRSLASDETNLDLPNASVEMSDKVSVLYNSAPTCFGLFTKIQAVKLPELPATDDAGEKKAYAAALNTIEAQLATNLARLETQIQRNDVLASVIVPVSAAATNSLVVISKLLSSDDNKSHDKKDETINAYWPLLVLTCISLLETLITNFLNIERKSKTYYFKRVGENIEKLRKIEAAMPVPISDVSAIDNNLLDEPENSFSR